MSKNYDEALKWYFLTLFLFNTIYLLAIYQFLSLYNFIFISYKQVIQLDPKHVNAWNNKGALLSDLGR